MAESFTFYVLAALILLFGVAVVTAKNTVHSVLYLIVVMLVNLKRPPEEHQDPNRRGTLGGVMAAAVMGELVVIATYNTIRPAPAPGATTPVGFVEPLAMALY